VVPFSRVLREPHHAPGGLDALGERRDQRDANMVLAGIEPALILHDIAREEAAGQHQHIVFSMQPRANSRSSIGVRIHR